MKYNETDLTEAIKIISYLKSIRIYAVIIIFLSFLFFGVKILGNVKNTERYLLYFFTSIILLGSLSFIIRQNYRTAFIYGLSCITAGVIYSFSMVYYRGETDIFFITTGFIIGLLVIRQGISVAFGRRSQEAFSRANQKKVSFLENLLKSLKQSLPDEKNIIHCTYNDDKRGKSNLKIKFLDDVACFLLNRQSTPLFFDRNNVAFFELQENPDSINVSIVAYGNDWLEAQMKPDDFKKYQAWHDL